ncbi:hypothetical protein JMJ58_24130 (plasmid) [Haloterrigena salifodinae]|uniref:IclR-ED domain-containing protein n=1 Tax=Haloterrigena salifodinae TaxID=2675099 RepID=A0A8T8E826_9EURY|nr:hypothetical protein JMJ58_24130 [Haloterrigena salifodinae]
MIVSSLETAREDGYATIRGERVPELGSIAVSVKKNGTVFGAVSVCCPISRASDERFEEELPKTFSRSQTGSRSI